MDILAAGSFKGESRPLIFRQDGKGGLSLTKQGRANNPYNTTDISGANIISVGDNTDIMLMEGLKYKAEPNGTVTISGIGLAKPVSFKLVGDATFYNSRGNSKQLVSSDYKPQNLYLADNIAHSYFFTKGGVFTNHEKDRRYLEHYDEIPIIHCDGHKIHLTGKQSFKQEKIKNPQTGAMETFISISFGETSKLFKIEGNLQIIGKNNKKPVKVDSTLFKRASMEAPSWVGQARIARKKGGVLAWVENNPWRTIASGLVSAISVCVLFVSSILGLSRNGINPAQAAADAFRDDNKGNAGQVGNHIIEMQHAIPTPSVGATQEVAAVDVPEPVYAELDKMPDRFVTPEESKQAIKGTQNADITEQVLEELSGPSAHQQQVTSQTVPEQFKPSQPQPSPNTTNDIEGVPAPIVAADTTKVMEYQDAIVVSKIGTHPDHIQSTDEECARQIEIGELGVRFFGEDKDNQVMYLNKIPLHENGIIKIDRDCTIFINEASKPEKMDISQGFINGHKTQELKLTVDGKVHTYSLIITEGVDVDIAQVSKDGQTTTRTPIDEFVSNLNSVADRWGKSIGERWAVSLGLSSGSGLSR